VGSVVVADVTVCTVQVTRCIVIAKMVDDDVGRSFDRERPGLPSQPIPVAMTDVQFVQPLIPILIRHLFDFFCVVL